MNIARLKECKTLVKLVAIGDAKAGVDLCKRIDEAVAEIEHLRDLLRRADAVVTWETTPAGRGFQEEIEAALGIHDSPAPRISTDNAD